MLTRSMLYHRKPLFWLFIALLTAAGAAGVWLLVRPPVRNAENQAIPSADQPYPLTILSGQNEIQVPGYVLWYENKKDGVSGDGMPISPRDIAGDIEYLTLDPDRESPLPFIPYVKGKEAYGQYRLYDEAFEEIPFFVPSGLTPQTYLFHGCGPGRYIVSFETSFEEGESIYGYRYFFGAIVTDEDKVASAPTPQDEHLTINLYQDGEYVHSATIDDAEQKQIVTDAIFSYMLKSAAWESVDIGSQRDRIVIRGAFDTEFYVFELDGGHYMQAGRDGLYAGISHGAYARLYGLTVGYLPEDLTVTCGEETFTVPGLVTYKKGPGEPEIQNQGYVIMPGYDDLPAIPYETDMALKIGDTPVHIFGGEPEQGEILGLCVVYDSEGNMLDNGHMMLSAFPPDFVEPETPGHYIVDVQIQEGDRDSMRHTQYVFAIDILNRETRE